jgi:hypothetical protein
MTLSLNSSQTTSGSSDFSSDSGVCSFNERWKLVAVSLLCASRSESMTDAVSLHVTAEF